MKDRIAQIMKEEQMSAIQFAKETGIQQASLSHILNGRNNPSLEIIKKIHQRFTHINLEWILYGEGEMINNPSKFNYSLFDENTINADDSLKKTKYDKEINREEYPNDLQIPIKETVKYIEKPQKEIIEIRIFFNDGTYETLIPQNKQF